MTDNQQHVHEFCKENGMLCSPEHRALDLVSEIGEVAKEILKTTNYGAHARSTRKELHEELGDAYFSLLELANTLDVDLDGALEDAIGKYRKRLKTGSAGSEQKETS